MPRKSRSEVSQALLRGIIGVMKNLWLVTQPASDDATMDWPAETTVAAYLDREMAADHASRIWAGRVASVSLFEALPPYLVDFPRDNERYALMGGKA